MMKWRTKREPVTVTREITVTNELGLHARPAAEFARCANRFRSEITLIKDGQRYAATRLIEILRANIDQGGTALLEAHGVDAKAAVETLVELLGNLRD
jgi:phosphotransferase system HPr (HPr) family protein